MNHKLYKIDYGLQYEAAAKVFFDLVEGWRNARNYRTRLPREHGYFYDTNSKQWIAFDNRTREFFVERYGTEREAIKFLTDGPNDLPA